jgi:hypothetical protein
MLALIKGGNRFEKIIGSDLPEGQSPFVAAMFDHLDEVDVVFPVPGKAEIVMHKIIISV